MTNYGAIVSHGTPKILRSAGIDEQQPKKKSLANITFRSRRSSTFQSATTLRRPRTFSQSVVIQRLASERWMRFDGV
jgi:hypothetical protein